MNRKNFAKIIIVLTVIFLVLIYGKTKIFGLEIKRNLQELEILNPYSHPQKGDNWEIKFTTNGSADLIIIPDTKTTIEDLEFISLKCGNEEKFPQILKDNVLFYSGWKCDQTASVSHLVKKAGNHTLKFQFGEKTKYAYNSAWPLGYNYRKQITINGTADGVQTNYQMKMNVYKDSISDSRLIGTTSSSGASNNSANYAQYTSYTAASSGTISSIRIYSRVAGNAKVALYSDSSGSPGSRLTHNSDGTACSAGQWNSITVPSYSITAGTTYWLAFIIDTAGVMSYNSGSETIKYKTMTYAGYTFPVTAESGLTTDSGYDYAIQGYGVLGNDVSLNNHCQDDFDDIRFTTSDGTTQLDYWIESYISGTSAEVWVEFDSIPASPSTANFYMYYGNAGASSPDTSQHMGEATFLFFDHFEYVGAEVLADKWTVGGGLAEPAASILTLDTILENLHTLGTYGTNTALRSRMYFSAAPTGGSNIMQYGNWTDYNSNCRIFEDPTGIYSLTGDDAGTTETQSPAAMTRAYNIYEIKRNSTTSVIFTKNDSVLTTHVTRVGTLARYIGFYHSSDKIIYSDWALVRKYTTNEPTFGPWGSESEFVLGGYEMLSGNYKIQSSSINVGGFDEQSSATYKLKDTIGEIASDNSSSASYKLKAGYRQMVEEAAEAATISLTSADDVVMSSTIGGVTGGTSNGSAVWQVVTDNSAGYTMSIKAGSDPALLCSSGGCDVGVDSFADYEPAGAAPDYSWLIANSASEFGFTPEGTDIVAKYKNDVSDNCNTGSSDTADKCWNGFSTSDETIASSSSTTGGTDTTIKFKAQSGTTHLQVEGTYTATITVTATMN